ncbi:E3 ubiquitin-protein ligase TRIM7-like isoform X2 [Hemicordylus capensis]|uniref:E3 ubiquitin-protein ligase TRIM7-like isoform X2 n=1 Tax=Hemicordylus capensis TaxID=884348 RepID=UPI0023042C8E|nr:E3 ubiquitin-protein ligase TRIM7-like isoform X2 [Hemicordylus capensis]
MAAELSLKDLQVEVKCPICLDYFTDPVILDCGHNFCRACLHKCWESFLQNRACPQCKEMVTNRSVIQNRQLKKVVELMKKLTQQATGAEEACKKHGAQEPLNLYCLNDQAQICSVCCSSKEHQDHMVLPAEEAVQELKGCFLNLTKTLKKNREEILEHKLKTEKEYQSLLLMQPTMQKVVGLFRGLCRFVSCQEFFLKTKMQEMAAETVKKRNEHMARLLMELSSVDSTIRDMEEKNQQPTCEFLRDANSIMQRVQQKTRKHPEAFSPELIWRIWELYDITPYLECLVSKFKVLEYGLQLQKANVTLDPDTAHRQLIISEDLKSVRRGERVQNVPNVHSRFDDCRYVLGKMVFISGRHFWDVLVGRKENWALGVARKSVKRKGLIPLDPKVGIWAVAKLGKQYLAMTPPCMSHLPLRGELKRVRVCLNCTGRQVTFFDADRMDLLFTTSITASEDVFLPFFFLPKKAHLTLVP